MKVAARSAECPGTWALRVSLLLAAGKTRSVCNMLRFHLTRTGSHCIYLNLHPIVREGTVLSRLGPLLQLKRGSKLAEADGWADTRTHGTSALWELHDSTQLAIQHKIKIFSDITSTPTPTMLISSFVHDLSESHSVMMKCSALKGVSAASLPLLIKIFNTLVRRRNLITELLSNKSWKQFKVNFPNMSIFLSCQKGC